MHAGGMRLFLEYLDGSVELPPGVTTIGRHVSCSLRFNDPFVSRRHVRIVLEDDRAFVEELESRNGTLLNGEQIEGRRPLADGDTLHLGKRSLRVALHERGAAVDDGETTRPDISDLTPALMGIEAAMRELESPDTVPAPAAERTCVVCRHRAPAAAARCPACGAPFPSGRPGSDTQRFDLSEIEATLDGALDRREGSRRPLDVPVVYTSETLTIDAVTSDLSRGGVFIRSPLLDEVGTRCQITLLPEAAPAIPVEGVVARVEQRPEETDASGMGIRFSRPGERARLWLEVVLDRGAA